MTFDGRGKQRERRDRTFGLGFVGVTSGTVRSNEWDGSESLGEIATGLIQMDELV
ncbi:uncharacterized protein Nmlp_3881 [Natronomonas moolapensis 8.8.11]|uniref:Uncharacterized protein n=1 Tax=Natronomonas moolapensis (strain DSM 18674 / CECT 7526 / JCM 14361 / 8.8.11) TaxID=268739 RepID=M1XLM7_NATM8|nr:uncharacterized protein Nmlp_3881 [Natronomonas moolapensis 8.8.11]